MIIDNAGRNIQYLRLAVTDRCNLRCSYCMPAHGLDWLSRKEIMSYEELLLLCRLLVEMGVDKIRITGGEPFVRKDIMHFLYHLSSLPGLKKLAITTNGVLTAPLVPELYKLGIRSVNLSLDTLDPDRFMEITLRDEFTQVMSSLETLLNHQMDVKINTVVMSGKNTADIIPMVLLTKNHPVAVRFIEEMPFNGAGNDFSGIEWNYIRILETIKNAFPGLEKIPDPVNSTSMNYRIPGHKGHIGIIAAYSRTFCGTCDRIRVTPTGILKTCLYGKGDLNIRDLIRSEMPLNQIQSGIINAIRHRAENGWIAEKAAMNNRDKHESMAEIGG